MPAPVPPSSSRSRRRSWNALLAAALTVAALGCRAPGQKLDAFPHAETREQMAGAHVVLRPLTPELVKAQEAGASGSQDLRELLVARPAPYRVGPQDVLLVTVWDHPELTTPLGQFRNDAATGTLVEEDGSIFFPFVGRLLVAGLTLPEVRTRLTTVLETSLRKPQVDVKVMIYRSQKVYIDGEVRTPATHAITDVPFTLAEAANRAGGFLPTADLSRVQLVRGSRNWTLNWPQLVASGGRLGQLLLKDEDTLHVPSRDEAPVYMMGELRNPRSVTLYNGRLTLAQAISDAGGLNTASADAKSLYVIRRGAGENEVEVFHLDVYNPVAMVLADRFQLQARDMVYVDGGPLSRWNRVLSMLLPTVNALASTATEWKYLVK